MAIEKVISIKVIDGDISAAVIQTEKLNKEFNKLESTTNKSSKSVVDNMRNGSKAVEKIDKQTGGLASSFIDVGKAAKSGGKAMRSALISTGIGAVVVLVGFLVEHWEDIEKLLDSTNKRLQDKIDLTNKVINNYDRELALLKSKEKIIELENGSTEEIRNKQIEILKLQAQQNI